MPNLRGAAALAVLVSMTACVGSDGPVRDAPEGPGGGKADEGGGDRPAFAWCTGHEHHPTPSGTWNHPSSALWAVAGHPRHTAQDVIGAPGGIATVRGKFVYGSTSKDLEGEWVSAYVHDCVGYRLAGTALTDTDGRVAVDVDVSDLGPGAYDLSLEVAVDASVARATLWLLPSGTHLVVSDVDGTLTTSDGELAIDLIADFFEPILHGDYVPRARPGGSELLDAHAANGEVVVYLTGRPHWLTDRSRAWLADLGFPAGVLHTTDTTAEAMPLLSGVGAYKRAYLEGLFEAGLVIDDAYGNASTDVLAYAEAGIVPEHTWIIGTHAGEDGTNPAGEDWQQRAVEVEVEPAVAQPFTW